MTYIIEPDEADEPEEIDETTSIYILDDDDESWINYFENFYNHNDMMELFWQEYHWNPYPEPEAINEPEHNPDDDSEADSTYGSSVGWSFAPGCDD
jgi:hypothetical protein